MSSFPQINAPFTDPRTGNIHPAWLELITSMWTRLNTLEEAQALTADSISAAAQEAALLAPPQVQIAVEP